MQQGLASPNEDAPANIGGFIHKPFQKIKRKTCPQSVYLDLLEVPCAPPLPAEPTTKVAGIA
jgi:hypothetical protein